MPTCTFCKKNYEFPKGTTVIQKDGSKKQFCSSKCRKNSEMGRLSKKVKWIAKSDIAKAQKAKREAKKTTKKE